MTIIKLETKLEKEHPTYYQRYVQAVGSINDNSDETNANAFRFAFALSNLFKGASDVEYAFVGEEAVLFHLMNSFKGTGVQSIITGFNDLDIITSDNKLVWEYIIQEYATDGEFTHRDSRVGRKEVSKDKCSIELKDFAYNLNTEELGVVEVDIDLYHPKNGGKDISFGGKRLGPKFFGELETMEIFGEQISVPTPYDLIDQRINFAGLRQKDVRMIQDLTTVLVHRETDPDSLAFHLDRRTNQILRDQVYKTDNKKLRSEPTLSTLDTNEARDILGKTSSFINQYCKSTKYFG